MKHAVIVRLKYPKDSKKWSWRSAFFRSMSVPFWERQTDKNFDLWVMCNEWHSEQVRAMSPIIKTFNVETKVSGDPGYDKRCGESNSVAPHPCDFFKEYDIQTRVDSDEIPNYDFVQSVHKNMGNAPCLLAYKRIRFHVKDLRLYKIMKQGDDDKKSSVLSLRWPGRYIYEVGHKGWSRLVPREGGQIKILDFGHVYCGTAWDNADAGLKGTDILI